MSTMENTSDLPSEDEAPSGNEAVFLKDELQILNSNRKIRQQLVKNLIGETYKLPDENADKTALLHLLDGLDKDAVQRAKLRLASKANDTMTDIKAVVAEALKRHRPTPSRPDGQRPSLSTLEYELTDAVPGELDQGMIPLSSKDIDL